MGLRRGCPASGTLVRSQPTSNCRRSPANRRRLAINCFQTANRRRLAINCFQTTANRRRLSVNRRRLSVNRRRSTESCHRPWAVALRARECVPLGGRDWGTKGEDVGEEGGGGC